MYTRPRGRQGPRTADITRWPAPTGGLVANRNLDIPEGAPAARLLENWFPTATGVVMRRGSEVYSTVGGGVPPVDEMFTYINGNQEEFLVATVDTIYDISVPASPVAVVSGLNSGDWVTTQFSTPGGTFLVAVNGTDNMLIYDGSFWYPMRATEQYTLAYTGGTIAFTVGHLLTGTTSGSKGTIVAKTGTVAAGTLTLTGVTGTFISGEPITDTSSGAAVASGTRKLHTNLHTLPYDTGTGNFTIGQIVTGSTSGAKAVIRNISGTTAIGTLIIDSMIGVFQVGETLTDPLGGQAVVDELPTLRLAGITGLGTKDTNIWSYVWIYKNRLFFIEEGTLNSWYLAVDSVGGVATVFPLGGVYSLGGSILFGGSWSIESADGLDSRCIFMTGNQSNSVGNEGEIAVYAGLDPGDPNQWGLIGVYRSGMPMGKRAHIRAGGDLIIATDLGLVPLSVAIQRDVAAHAPSSMSNAIEDLWSVEVERRSLVEWKCKTWPSGRMVVVMLPTVEGSLPTWFVANLRTGAWCIFTGWDARCLTVYQDRLFFGSDSGKVVEAMITGFDQGLPYTATIVPLFEHLGSPASIKIPSAARAVLRSPVPVVPSIKMLNDYMILLQAAPAAVPVQFGDVWNAGIWNYSKWSSGRPPLVTVQQWVSAAGLGYTLSPALRVTSGALVPLDCELVRIEALYTIAEVMS